MHAPLISLSWQLFFRKRYINIYHISDKNILPSQMACSQNYQHSINSPPVDHFGREKSLLSQSFQFDELLLQNPCFHPQQKTINHIQPLLRQASENLEQFFPLLLSVTKANPHNSSGNNSAKKDLKPVWEEGRGGCCVLRGGGKPPFWRCHKVKLLQPIRSRIRASSQGYSQQSQRSHPQISPPPSFPCQCRETKTHHTPCKDG